MISNLAWVFLTVTSPVLGANCYLVASGKEPECLIIDPGIGVESQLDTLMAEHSLRPAAALITHGHVDHIFALSRLCQRYDLPVYLHEADAYRLADPIGTLGLELAAMFAGFTDEWITPPDVRTFSDSGPLNLAGIHVRALHAPGHTEGSTLYYIPAITSNDAGLCFTGDVLFAGTIGRTDLPGGNDELMRHTLAELAKPETAGGLPGTTTVLPGHGKTSTFSRERDLNPYLRPFRQARG